jgi:diacylglycerol kinase (ATP)
MSSPAIVMLNGQAGDQAAARLRPLISAWLGRNAAGVPLLEPRGAHEALATLIILAPRTRVILVGGDGTLHSMLPALLRRGHQLGLVPCGRNNRLAHRLGLGALDWEQALHLALEQPAQAIDLGQVDTPHGSWPFASCLSAGFEARVVSREQHAPEWLSHPPLRSLTAFFGEQHRFETTPMRIWVDGQLRHDDRSLSISLGLRSTPDATSSLRSVSAQMAARVLGPVSRMTALRAVLSRERGAEHPKIESFRLRQIQVEATRNLPLVTDGETLPTTPRFGVQLLSRAVQAVGRFSAAAP